MKYHYIVTVDTDTVEHAEQVMAERLDYDEQYYDDEGVAFNYQFTNHKRVGTQK